MLPALAGREPLWEQQARRLVSLYSAVGPCLCCRTAAVEVEPLTLKTPKQSAQDPLKKQVDVRTAQTVPQAEARSYPTRTGWTHLQQCLVRAFAAFLLKLKLRARLWRKALKRHVDLSLNEATLMKTPSCMREKPMRGV